MRCLFKIILYAISSIVFFNFIRFGGLPAVAFEYQQNPLPVSDYVDLTMRKYLYVHTPDLAPELDRIIACESGWNPQAKNKYSSASGLAQFIEGTWIRTREAMNEDPNPDLRFDPYENLRTMIWLFRRDGASHWRESLNCHGVI